MRALLKTYPTKLDAELALEQLTEAGIAAVVMQTVDPAPYHPNAMSALWLEDASLLDDFEKRQIIEDILADYVMLPEDEAAIAEMPLEEPEPASFQNRYLVVLAICAAAVILIIGFAMRFRMLAER